MRTEVRITFTGHHIPGGAQAVLGPAGCGPDVATVTDVPVLKQVDVWVTLEETDPRLPLLRQLLTQHGRRWLEWHEDRYTEEELGNAPLLLMSSKGQFEISGGVAWGTTFDLSGACPACATGCQQTSALFVDGEQVPELEGQRAASTYFWHVLVDGGLAADLEASGATGLSLRSVYGVMPDKRQVQLRWKQLCSENTLPRMSPSTTGLDRERPCGVCMRNGYVETAEAPTRIVYRAADLRGALDVNQTWENTWFASIEPDFRKSILSRPWTIVTPKVWRVFRDAGVTSFDWYPIRVEDDGA